MAAPPLDADVAGDAAQRRSLFVLRYPSGRVGATYSAESFFTYAAWLEQEGDAATAARIREALAQDDREALADILAEEEQIPLDWVADREGDPSLRDEMDNNLAHIEPNFRPPVWDKATPVQCRRPLALRRRRPRALRSRRSRTTRRACSPGRKQQADPDLPLAPGGRA
jgi:hypothetical protein